MKKISIYKKLAISLSTMLAALMLTVNFASAASTLPYTGASTNASPIPAFDVFYATPGNPLPSPAPSGAESNFLEARVPDNANPALDITTPYSESPLSTSCTNGEVIQLRVYVHNGADAAYNNNGTGPSVAHGVQVQVNIPSTQSTTFDPNATISATNATSVSDDLVLDCTGGQAVELQYVPGSASQYSVATNAFTTLPDTIVTTGTSIQSESVAGDVWACWNDRVIAILLVKVVIPTTPPVITTPPPAPKVLVNTGPGNVVGIFFGISLLAGVGYFLRGRYLVRK